MIYLIGGSSHVGKTLLANKLMQRLHVPYFSLDYLKMGLIRSKMTKLTTEQDGDMRTFMWPLVREIIKTAVENRQDLIMEGCYIPCDWRDSFSEEYLSKIRAVFIVMDEKYIRSHEKEIVEYGDVIEHRFNPSVNIERLVFCSAMFEAWAAETGNSYLKISGDNYNPDELLENICTLMGI